MTAGRHLEHLVKALLTASVSKVTRMKQKGNDKKEKNYKIKLKGRQKLLQGKIKNKKIEKMQMKFVSKFSI
jgi:hypothetical protein